MMFTPLDRIGQLTMRKTSISWTLGIDYSPT